MINENKKIVEYNHSNINKANEFLKKYGRENSIKTNSELIGFLSSCICSPFFIFPNIWGDRIWFLDDSRFVIENDTEEFTKLAYLLTSFYYDCNNKLSKHEYSKYFEGDDAVNVVDWWQGIIRGQIYWQKHLKYLFQTEANLDEYAHNKKFMEALPEIKSKAKTFITLLSRINTSNDIIAEYNIYSGSSELEKEGIAELFCNFYDYMQIISNQIPEEEDEFNESFDFPKDDPYDEDFEDELEGEAPFKKIFSSNNSSFKTTQNTIQNQTIKPNRNDSCLCGSGKKYKKCCGNK